MDKTPKKSKREIVYEYILRQFMAKEYKSGDHLNISQLASECHVSEIPVREALRQLEGDGYVVFSSNQGAFAAGINHMDVFQLIQVKAVLEGFASRLALSYLKKNDINELKRLNAEMKDALNRNATEEYSKLNIQFHELICLNCGNATLIKLLENLWRRSEITKQVFFGSPVRMKESNAEHEQIIRLIEDRDYNGLENYIRMHKMQTASYWLIGNVNVPENQDS